MKRVAIIISSVLIALVGVWGYRWWNSPAETKNSSALQTEKEVLGTKRTLSPWNTQSFATRYPSDLRIITTNEIAHGITTGQYLLGSTTPNITDQLAVTVGRLSNASLEDLPGVKLRQQRTDVYVETTMQFTPPGGQVFSAVEGYELAMFWKDGSNYAAAVVSGSSAREAELQEALEAVVANWQWRS